MKPVVRRLLIAGNLGLAYALMEWVLPGRVNGSTLAYILRPLIWLGVAAIALPVLRTFTEVRDPPRQNVRRFAVVLGVTHVLVLITLGLALGFGRSPYVFTFRGLVTNTLFAFSALAGIEVSRAALLAGISRKHVLEVLVAVALLLMLAQIPLVQLMSLDSVEQLVGIAATRMIPLIAQGMLLGLLAYAGGLRASLYYAAILTAFHWYSPVLPNLPWAIASLASTIVPMGGILWVAYTNADLLPEDRKVPEVESISGAVAPRRGHSAFWVGLSLFALILTWFAAGLLGPRPLLVASGSMRPSMDVGDIAIVSTVDPGEIAVDDVIAFSTPGGVMMHRVVNVTGDGEARVFLTKGDDNLTEDREPVLASNVVGRVSTVVPKVGWIAIPIKNAMAAVF